MKKLFLCLILTVTMLLAWAGSAFAVCSNIIESEPSAEKYIAYAAINQGDTKANEMSDTVFLSRGLREASSRCYNLREGNVPKGTWRVPTVDEVQKLIGTVYSFDDIGVFQYWTRTPHSWHFAHFDRDIQDFQTDGYLKGGDKRKSNWVGVMPFSYIVSDEEEDFFEAADIEEHPDVTLRDLFLPRDFLKEIPIISEEMGKRYIKPYPYGQPSWWSAPWPLKMQEGVGPESKIFVVYAGQGLPSDRMYKISNAGNIVTNDNIRNETIGNLRCVR